jgi:hypothetical protein
VRIAYLGRMLKEHESLLGQGWQPGHVINALIASRGSILNGEVELSFASS